MRISPIGCSYAVRKTAQPAKTVPNQNFQGKHSGAKWGAAIFGTAATLGAIGGSLIMTGGLSAIPLLAAYAGIGAGAGALIGNEVDKGNKNTK